MVRNVSIAWWFAHRWIGDAWWTYLQGYFYCSFNRFLRAYIASHKSLFKVFVACGPPANHFLKVLMLAGLPQIIPQKVWSFRAWRKLFPEWFGISALSESHFPKGLVFPRMAKVISRMVWHFRAWRKSFPERFGISALGESRFPNGLTFPRMAKVVSRMVWHFRAWRKSFLEWFGVSAHGESHLLKVWCLRILQWREV